MDHSGKGVLKLRESQLLPTSMSASFTADYSVNKMQSLFHATSFIEDDGSRNGGGNMILSESLCQYANKEGVRDTLRVVDKISESA